MKSTAVNIYDYHKLSVPEKLTAWEALPASQIEARLAELSRQKATEIFPNQVDLGDSVRCRDILTDALILLYPGRRFPGAENAERDVIGKVTGAVFSTSLLKKDCRLKVETIIRRTPLPVTDELIKTANISGVETLEQYQAWCRAQHREEQRQIVIGRVAEYWLEAMLNQSEYNLDKAEQEAWLHERGKLMFEAFLAAGIDYRIPDEGFELLTDQQAIEKLACMQSGAFPLAVLAESFCKMHGIQYTGSEAKLVFQKGLADKEYSVLETKMSENITMCLDCVYQYRLMEILRADAKQYLSGVAAWR